MEKDEGECLLQLLFPISPCFSCSKCLLDCRCGGGDLSFSVNLSVLKSLGLLSTRRLAQLLLSELGRAEREKRRHPRWAG
ncbi:hypothetical protein GmHk_19G053917 [Glycine max]|nr:hypothetical protein GmHk_19G053917 [Glycine max]